MGSGRYALAAARGEREENHPGLGLTACPTVLGRAEVGRELTK